MLSSRSHSSTYYPSEEVGRVIAAVSGVQFTEVEVTGKRGKFVQHMMQSLMQIDPNMKVTHNQMSQAVAAQLRLMEIEGLPMDRSDKRKWLVVLDRAGARSTAAKGLSGDALAGQLARSMQKSGELPRLRAEAFTAGVASKTFDAGGNVLIGIVQAFNFTKLVSDYRQGMSHEKNEAAARLATGAMAIIGTFGEAVGVGLQRMQEVKLRTAPGLAMSQIPDALRVGGRYLGLGAGMLIAGMDSMQAVEAYKKGDIGLTMLYAASTVLGAGLAAAFFASSMLGPIGWLLVGIAMIALFVVTALIEKEKDNKVQEWLMRCHFGTHAQKYGSHAKQAEELERAFA